MKLAEALLLRTDMNVELGRLGRRLARNARVEKGSVPGEDPLVLLEEALRTQPAGRCFGRHMGD